MIINELMSKIQNERLDFNKLVRVAIFLILYVNVSAHYHQIWSFVEALELQGGHKSRLVELGFIAVAVEILDKEPLNPVVAIQVTE
jgi:hypothetical protein